MHGYTVPLPGFIQRDMLIALADYQDAGQEMWIIHLDFTHNQVQAVDLTINGTGEGDSSTNLHIQ